MSWVNFHNQPLGVEVPVDNEIKSLWQEYLIDILGIPAKQAQPRIEAEVSGKLHNDFLDGLESQGWVFRDAIVLDVGCGTGSLASALVDKGAQVIGVEPSPEWATGAHRRLKARDVSYGQVVVADGATLPLTKYSVDYVISLQVLEHVPMPVAKQVIHEIARVLRPGGRVHLAFENYCSFWEPHYRMRWFPLLPKKIGSIYLRLRGRNPYFLHKHIYYNSALELARTCLERGLISSPWSNLIAKVEKPDLVIGSLKRRVIRLLRLLLPTARKTLIIFWIERAQLFNTTFHLELTHEPDCHCHPQPKHLF